MQSTIRTLRLLVVPTYLPMIIGTFGSAMLIPVLPLYLDDSGLSLGTASVVLAGVGIGSSLGGLPSGSALARYGERATMIAAFVIMVVSTAPIGLTDTALLLVVLRVLFGVATVALRLSRQTYVTRRVEASQRGRALSLVGGSFRVALLLGPLVGGAMVDWIGFRATFVVAASTAAIGLVPAVVPDRGTLPVLADSAAPLRGGLLAGLRDQWARLLVGGCLPMLVMLVREGRYVVLPLIADDLGLSATEVGAIITVSTASDLALFPAAGWIMDRFGRLKAMVPAFGLIAAGLVVLGLAETTSQVILAGAIIGVGNGLSSGTMLTLGSDLAPIDSPGPFLAGMAVLQSGGRILGPLLVGFVGARMGLGAAAIALALVMVIAVVWLTTMIGESSRPESLRSAALRPAPTN